MLTSHAKGIDTLKGSCPLNTVYPIVVDVLGVRGIVPVPVPEQIPLNRCTTHHGFLMTGPHHDSPPVSESLVLRIIDVESTTPDS